MAFISLSQFKQFNICVIDSGMVKGHPDLPTREPLAALGCGHMSFQPAKTAMTVTGGALLAMLLLLLLLLLVLKAFGALVLALCEDSWSGSFGARAVLLPGTCSLLNAC